MYAGHQIPISRGNGDFGQAAASTPEPMREIPREWESVCQRMEYLEAMTAQLVDRLSPLLMKRPGGEAKNEAAEAPIGTPMGNDLYCLKRRIQHVGDRLSLAAQDLAL